MATRKRQRPRCIVIAGPNGAGKTTFAREYLPGVARVIHFVNADLIAGGLSPLKPELAAIAAARIVLREIDRLAFERVDFAFETTLADVPMCAEVKPGSAPVIAAKLSSCASIRSTWRSAELMNAFAKRP